MQARSLVRPWLWRLALAATCAATQATCAAQPATEAARTVQDPHYGDALFHFYQPRYFSALTGLMVSQHFERMPQHADEAEVLRGGLLLSYGLHREAGEVFERLIDKGASPSVRDRAWFFLAKIRYQRGWIDEALDAIGRIESPLPPMLEDDRALLHAQLLMARADYAGAAAVLKALPATSDAALFARYNLGVALIKSGDLSGGVALLDAIGRMPAPDEETRALRDKANVALGFGALQGQQPEQARQALQRVRLASAQSNKALLGMGWAATSLKKPQLAVVPWTELLARDVGDAAVLEAHIALPYAYAELGARGQSLARYQDAIALFEREHVHLDESIAAIRSGTLLNALLQRNPGEEMGWFWSLRELPEMPHAAHLSQVLAEHEFQEAFKNYRDLIFLGNNLQQWADKLVVFDDMLSNRQLAYSQRLPQVRAKASATDLAAAAQRVAAVAQDLAQAERDADGVALANAAERRLQSLLAGLQAALAQPGASADITALRERVRRVAGALSWELAQQFPTRLWEAQKSLITIESQLGQARAHDAALTRAQQTEPQRFAAFAQRIQALAPRIQALIPRVAELSQAQQLAAQDIAVAALTRQQERLAAYGTQARFAVAQLHDNAHDSAPANAHDRAQPKEDTGHVAQP